MLRASAEVWLFGLIKAATIAIARGENKGRTITYHNVVRRWIKLGDWTGKAQFLEHPGADARGRWHRRSGRPGAERHDGKAEGILGAALRQFSYDRH